MTLCSPAARHSSVGTENRKNLLTDGQQNRLMELDANPHETRTKGDPYLKLFCQQNARSDWIGTNRDVYRRQCGITAPTDF